MAKVLLLSLASALVTAQQPRFIQQSDFNQQATFNGQSNLNQQATFNGPSPIDPTISYNYGYDINDKDTGDSKTHQEALENGVLRGSYSVVQPDGLRRIVEYEADENSGFQANVRYESGYPIQTPPQRRPSAGGAGSSQGSSFSSGSSSKGSSSSGSSSSGSSLSGSSSSRPSQGTRFLGSHQGSRFTGGAAAQQPRFPAGTSQGPRFGPPGPTSQGTPSISIGGPPPQTSQFQGSRISPQSSGQSSPSRFTGSVSQGAAAQQPIFPAGTSQGPRFGPPGPTSQGTPSRSIGGPPPQPSQFQGSRISPQSSGQSSPSRFAGSVSQGRPSGSLGVSASQGSQFRPASFPGAPTGSSASINSSRRPQGSGFSSGSSSQSGSALSQNTFAPRPSQAGQSSLVFSGPGPLTQGISTGSRLQAGPGSVRLGASAIRRPGAPFSSQSNAQADVAVQIAPDGFFSQRDTPSSSAIAVQAGSAGAFHVGLNSAAFGASSQAGISGAPFGAAAQAGFSGAAFQQDRSSSRFHSGAPSVSIQSSNPFQSGQGSRFTGGPAFDQLISSSLLVTDENLDSIDAVELASAGFADSSYAYRLVPVPVNN